MFRNRIEAGLQLASKVEQYLAGIVPALQKSSIVIVGLPRGGVPVASELARRLDTPLDVIVAKKLPFPNEPEYAIGAVCTGAITVLSPQIPKTLEWSEYVEKEKRNLLATVQRREDEFYRLSRRRRSSLEGKFVIIVDDGIATGMTALAAIEAVKQRGARQVILAAPVISKESLEELRHHCDAVIAVHIPQIFNSVGQYYNDFRPTTDNEVVRALSQSNDFDDCPGGLKSVS